MRIATFAFGLLVVSSLPAFAYTQEDANACTPDVMRLCQQAIPDQNRITQCLYQHRSEVTPACYAVYKRFARDHKGRSRVTTGASTEQ